MAQDHLERLPLYEVSMACGLQEAARLLVLRGKWDDRKEPKQVDGLWEYSGHNPDVRQDLGPQGVS